MSRSTPTCCAPASIIDSGKAALQRRLGGGEGWHARGKSVKPADKARMIAAPSIAEAQIAIPEHTGQRDLSDIRHCLERRRRGFECCQPPRHLTGLVVEPLLLVVLRRPPAALIDGQDRGIENDVT